jgi:hypothetical protein
MLFIGIEYYNSNVSSTNWGGFLGQLPHNKLLVRKLKDATCNFTKFMLTNSEKFNNMNLMKCVYKIITPSIYFDDINFIKQFAEDWKKVKKEDFKGLIYFYNMYIEHGFKKRIMMNNVFFFFLYTQVENARS